ncbi:PEPxxWA-CTERM sorting domain-containing protein [Polymorphobacter fuscus]|nr:PEPxxWA-CTERM sorting domain-containing protein [Polymorphobacter fuscus]NJC07393.1 hypothetical protein [Polymorphobacter fuscus]
MTIAAVVLGTVATMPTYAAVTLTSVPYTQDFNALASTGTSSVLPTGWAIAESGSNANATYAANNGSNNAGNTYSYGATGSSERALGGLASGSLVPRFGAEFTNNLGSTITQLDIAYFGELWRVGTSGNLNTLSFSYSLDATSLTNGTYTEFSALNYSVAPGTPANAARDGNANRTAISGVITGLNIAQGDSVFLRWTGTNAAFNDHGLAIDDFQLSATAAAAVVPEPSSWAMLIAGFGMVGAAARRRRTSVVA